MLLQSEIPHVEKTFQKVKKLNSNKIADILIRAYNNENLIIRNNPNDAFDTIDEYESAFVIAMAMLKQNDLKIKEK